ncbi:hypothetical protein [Pilimelia columellifera]|uniref:Secreted protein n=1 Tax=Pilimelia columellifera subsp. columellifera TaxID=706583 RepID=A0ABP6AFP1_9ACTN
MRTAVVRTALVVAAAAAALATGAPALAGPPPTFNSADIVLSGGNANSLSHCVNYAKTSLSYGKKPRSNACRSFAKANGGTVTLDNVSVFVNQEGSLDGGGRTYNKARVAIVGGDANAISSCMNVLQGTANNQQTNTCKSGAKANGGNVHLKDVSITVMQLGS